MKTNEEKLETLKYLIMDSIINLLYYDRKGCEVLSLKEVDDIVNSYKYKTNLVNELTETFREHLEKAINNNY